MAKQTKYISKRKQNNLITQICSFGSTISIMAFAILLLKYREHYQWVIGGFIVFFIVLIVAVFVISSLAEKKRIEKAMATKEYDSMSGEEFEEFCADILRENGYKEVRVTKASGDHGIDVLAKKDGVKYAIQRKRYSKPVGNKAVQEAYSGKDIYKADVAVVMTSMSFTKQAIEDAAKLKVQLWDRDKIYSLQKAGNTGEVTNQDITTAPDGKENLICPNCGGTLVLRTAKKGPNVGSSFYGCSNFPKCKYTRDK